MIRPLYKAQAPFMEVARGSGFQGVIMYDDAEDKVQCHICGKYYSLLGKHVSATHNMTTEDYKIEYGLSLGVALCGTGISALRSKLGRKLFADGKFQRLECRKGVRRKLPRRKPNSSIQTKNKFGLCDMQILARYEVVKKICGRIPMDGDFRKHDRMLFQSMKARHGTINAFRKHIGEQELTRSQAVKLYSIPKLDLIAALRSYQHKYGRRPTARAFDKGNHNGPCRTTFYREFGSWDNALHSAGLK